jgi:hypothetical protein
LGRLNDLIFFFFILAYNDLFDLADGLEAHDLDVVANISHDEVEAMSISTSILALHSRSSEDNCRNAFDMYELSFIAVTSLETYCDTERTRGLRLSVSKQLKGTNTQQSDQTGIEKSHLSYVPSIYEQSHVQRICHQVT